jgi:hypothetical protein
MLKKCRHCSKNYLLRSSDKGVQMYDDIDLSNAPQPPLKLRGGEGELCNFDR